MVCLSLFVFHSISQTLSIIWGTFCTTLLMTPPMLLGLSLICGERQTTCYMKYVFTGCDSALKLSWLCHTLFHYMVMSCGSYWNSSLCSQTSSLMPLNLIPCISRPSTSCPAVMPSLLLVLPTCISRTLSRSIPPMTEFVQSIYSTGQTYLWFLIFIAIWADS